MIVLSLLVIASISAGALGGSLPVENLDLRVVSQLRVELRHIQRTKEQCELFWKGLKDKLGDQDGNQLDRTATLKKLSERLQSRRSFEKLAEFVDRCVSGRFEDTNNAESDQLGSNPSELAELRNKVQSLEAAAKGREEQAAKLALMEEKVRALEAELSAKDGQNKEATQQVKDLTAMEEKVRVLEAELVAAKEGQLKESNERAKDQAAMEEKVRESEAKLSAKGDQINRDERQTETMRLLEANLREKEDKIKELTVAKDVEARKAQDQSKVHIEQASKLAASLAAMHSEMERIRAESSDKDERFEQMRVAREADMKRFIDLSEGLKEQTNKLLHESQQVGQLKIELANCKAGANPVEEEKERNQKLAELERLEAKVRELEAELESKSKVEVEGECDCSHQNDDASESKLAMEKNFAEQQVRMLKTKLDTCQDNSYKLIEAEGQNRKLRSKVEDLERKLRYKEEELERLESQMKGLLGMNKSW